MFAEEMITRAFSVIPCLMPVRTMRPLTQSGVILALRLTLHLSQLWRPTILVLLIPRVLLDKPITLSTAQTSTMAKLYLPRFR